MSPQFDLESQLSSSVAFHLIICGSCFAILLWYEEDGSNAVLVVRGKMFSGFSEETTFCVIAISTKGLFICQNPKDIPRPKCRLGGRTSQDGGNKAWRYGVAPDVECHCRPLRDLLKPRSRDPALRVSDLVFLGQGPKICISNMLPGAAAAGVPGHTLRTRAWGRTQWPGTWCPPFPSAGSWS